MTRAELKSAANQAIKETLNTYEEPFRKELENRREQGAERMNDVAALRSLCNEYMDSRRYQGRTC